MKGTIAREGMDLGGSKTGERVAVGSIDPCKSIVRPDRAKPPPINAFRGRGMAGPKGPTTKVHAKAKGRGSRKSLIGGVKGEEG